MNRIERAVLKGYIRQQYKAAQKGGTARQTMGDLNALGKACFNLSTKIKNDGQQRPAQDISDYLQKGEGLQAFLFGGTFGDLVSRTSNISRGRYADIMAGVKYGVQHLRRATTAESAREQAYELRDAAFQFTAAAKAMGQLVSYTTPDPKFGY